MEYINLFLIGGDNDDDGDTPPKDPPGIKK